MPRKKFIYAALLLSCVFPPFLAAKTPLLIEAESFDDKGGWVVDQQYMDQMGSPVLLSHGYGEPVQDAVTKTFVPCPGDYRVFVRTRNWVARWAPDESPGVFRLLVNGRPLDTVFGNVDDRWHWQFGGVVRIETPEVELRLHDLTGFDGRCDAILLTDDHDFVPPESAAELDAFRREALSLSARPQNSPLAGEGPFDLVVCGGGVAGICSAVSAARLGLKVALIQDRPVLGGNNSSEVRVHLMGRTNYPPYPNLGNLVHEIDPLQLGNARAPEVYRDDQKLAVVRAEKNLSLYLSTHVIAVETDRSAPEGYRRPAIKAVIGKNIETGKELRFEGLLFADCTGDAGLAVLAGAEWRMGRESKTQTGETHAPEEPDRQVLGASTQWYSVEAKDEHGDPVETKFPILPWAVQFNEDSIQPALEGEWDWETGMNQDQVLDAEAIRDHALRAVYGHWSYMKNKAPDAWKEKAKNRKLGWVAFIAGKRESRRIMGDVLLKEEDVVQRKSFPDACVTTTWTIDLHYPTERQKKHFPGEEFRSVARHLPVVPYMIPYRCLYSKDVPNLFMAGRNISVTHIALGTVRVQRTGGMMGEVVGMAASLCRRHATTPREVYEKHLTELTALFEKGVAAHPGKYFSTAAPTGLTAEIKAPSWISTAGPNLARDASFFVSGKQVKEPAPLLNDGRFDFKDDSSRQIIDHVGESTQYVFIEFGRPVSVNALRILSGWAPGESPVFDFSLQYPDPPDGAAWIDVAETITSGNNNCDFGVRFRTVTSPAFRLAVTAAPRGRACIWEIELYEISSRSNP